MNRPLRLLFFLFSLFALVRPAACQIAVSRPLLSASNLKQIGLAVTMYMQDHNAKLPPMRSAAAAQKALRPYVKNDSFFRQPWTREPYLPNPFFARRTLDSFDRPAEMVIYYEARPDTEGRRAVLFLDGHVKCIRESEWPALKAASHIPNVRPHLR